MKNHSLNFKSIHEELTEKYHFEIVAKMNVKFGNGKVT
jgi:hypothetical protein